MFDRVSTEFSPKVVFPQHPLCLPPITLPFLIQALIGTKGRLIEVKAMRKLKHPNILRVLKTLEYSLMLL
jgi:hypothetical protein